MPIDASIPLNYNPTPLMSPAQLLSLKDLSLRVQQDQQEFQKTQAINKVLQSPGSVGPNGMLSLNAITGVTQIDPVKGFQLSNLQNQLEQRNRELQQKKIQRGLDIEKGFVEDYDRLLLEMPPDKALMTAKQNRMKAIDEFESSGEAATYQFNDQELNTARRADRHPDATRASLMSHGIDIPVQGGQFQKDLIAAGTLPGTPEWKAAMKKRVERETSPTSISLAGQAVPSRDALTLAVDQYLAGDSSAAQGYGRNALAKKAFTERLAERAKELHMSGKDIANKVAEFQSLKAAERTAGTTAGRVAYAGEDVKEAAQLVRQSSAKLPRGEFIPFNKLMQMRQSAFSDPNLARYRLNMISLSNAYDMLAARGGTDKEKRAENRKSFELAQSPEALEAVIQGAIDEARASGRAGRASIKSLTEEEPASDIKSKVEAAGQTYDPETYEYRIGPNGNVQRRKKGG